MDENPALLDALMRRLSLTNADLVRHSPDQLTFKMVQKGRKGRRLTPNVRKKIIAALKAARPEEPFDFKQIFIEPV